MQKIGNLNIYVGAKEEYQQVIDGGMKIVCALNRADGYITHQSVVGWTGIGCNKDNPFYLYKEEDNAIYLNMIDGNKPEFVNDTMINAALNFIDRNIKNNEKVFIYCSLAESRSPSIALMYMLEYKLIEAVNAISNFRDNFYNKYNPKKGNLEYILKRWSIVENNN